MIRVKYKVNELYILDLCVLFIGVSPLKKGAKP